MVKPTRKVTLNRASRSPLWEQLLTQLRCRLEAGEFSQAFPPDRELMSQYGLSRHTVREAVGRLDQAGLLDRGRGRGGTKVRKVEFEQPSGTIYSLFLEVEATGASQVSRVLSLELRRDREAALQLGVSPNAQMVYLELVRQAGQEPLALDRAWLPASLARPLLEADFSHTAIYDELRSRCGIELDSGWERVAPAVPTVGERRLLGLRAGQAVFSIERLTAACGRAVEWRQSLVRGDRYAFVVEWPGAAAAPGRSGLRGWN